MTMLETAFFIIFNVAILVFNFFVIKETLKIRKERIALEKKLGLRK